MKKLYVCRHGESELNAKGFFSGQIDTPLTEKGRVQALMAGQAATIDKIDLIIASPLDRTAETARIIATQLDYPVEQIVFEKLFIEQSLGSLEGTSWEGIHDFSAHPDAEQDTELLARAERGLAFLQERSETNILLVSHGSYLLAMRRLLKTNLPESELPNAVVVQFI